MSYLWNKVCREFLNDSGKIIEFETCNSAFCHLKTNPELGQDIDWRIVENFSDINTPEDPGVLFSRSSNTNTNRAVETQLSLQDKLDIYSRLIQATSMLDMSTDKKDAKIIEICRRLYELLDSPQK